MTFKIHQNTFHTIRPGDKNFTITDGLIQYNRAGLEINEKCPTQYRQMLMTALDLGWIKPVANVTERELIFMGLTK